MKKAKAKNKIYTDMRFKFEIEEIEKTKVMVNLVSIYKKKERYIFKEAYLNVQEFVAMSLFLMATIIWMKDKISKREKALMYKCPIIIHNKKGELLLLTDILKAKKII